MIVLMLEGYDYDLTAADVMEAYDRFMAAAERLGVAADARGDVRRLAAKSRQEGGVFHDVLLRRTSGSGSSSPIEVRRDPPRPLPRR